MENMWMLEDFAVMSARRARDPGCVCVCVCVCAWGRGGGKVCVCRLILK
jgi:hypothetical protein